MNATKTEWPNLYLVGFMGTGKSAVGRRIAHNLHMTFLDVDNEIEIRERKTIATIFAQKGETAFRRMERDFIKKGHPTKNCIVACGGGLVIQPGMLKLLKQRGIVISLYASPEEILRRTKGNFKRPLLNVANPRKRIQELLKEREPIYKKAGPLIMTEGCSIEEVTAHVQRVFKREAARFRRAPINSGTMGANQPNNPSDNA